MYKTPPFKPTIHKNYPFLAKIFHFVLNIHSSPVLITDVLHLSNQCFTHIFLLHMYKPCLATHIFKIYSIYRWQLSDLLIATWAKDTSMLGRYYVMLKKASYICQRVFIGMAFALVPSMVYIPSLFCFQN